MAKFLLDSINIFKVFPQKVKGLSNTPYNGFRENADGAKVQQCMSSTRRNSCTAINLSSSEFAELRKKLSGVPSSRTRPTRNPMFHRNTDEACDIENEQSISELPSTDQNEQTKSESNSKTENELSRPYFFDKTTMSRLKHIMFLGMTTGTFPWKWDNSKHKIEQFSPTFLKLWKLFRLLFAIQSCCITVFQAHVFWQLASSGKVTNRQIFIASFNLMWYIEWMDFAVNMYIYGEQVHNLQFSLLHKYFKFMKTYKNFNY